MSKWDKLLPIKKMYVELVRQVVESEETDGENIE